MKVVFFITCLGGGGAERVLCNLASFLAEKGHNIVITVLRGNDKQYSVNGNVKIKYLQSNYYLEKKHGIFSHIKEFMIARSFLKRLEKDDLLVTFLELPMALSLLLRNSFKSKLIICERNNPLFYSKGYQLVFQHFAKRANACVCQTSVIASWYKPKLNERAYLKVIPNAVSSSLLAVEPSKGEAKTIVTVGRLSQQKNQEMLIRAFAKIASQYQDYKLYIYGEGPLRTYLEGLTENLGMSDRILLPGFKADIVELLNETGIFVLTSNHEGMPNVLEEAMVMGLPCISTDCGGGGARELISDGINGVLIAKNDVEALVIAMSKLIENREFARELGCNAIKLRSELNPNTIHSTWESFFMSIPD